MNIKPEPSPDTDFIRLSLHDTQNGTVHPESLLTEWLGELDTLQAALNRSPPGELLPLFKLLAITGRIQRSRFAETDPSLAERFERAEQLTQQLQKDDYERLFQLLANKDFRHEATQFLELWTDERIDDQEAVRQAIAILSDWDDSGIILARLGDRFEMTNADIGKARSDFLVWLCTEGDSILLLASNWIQTMAAAFDPDLAEKNLDLDVSTEGYVHLLDTLEEQEKAMDCHPDWIAAKIQGLAEYLPQKPTVATAGATASRSSEPAKKKNYLTYIGTALSLLIVASVLLLSFTQTGKKDTVADARTSWLATDFEPPSDLARKVMDKEDDLQTETQIQNYETKITQTPNDTEILLQYGRFLLRKERTNEAVVIFEKAQRQTPDNPYVHLGLGIAEVLNKNDHAAQAHFETALSSAQADPWAKLYAHINAGDCCLRLENRTNEAVKHHQAALALIEQLTLEADPPLHSRLEKMKEDILYELHRTGNVPLP